LGEFRLNISAQKEKSKKKKKKACAPSVMVKPTSNYQANITLLQIVFSQVTSSSLQVYLRHYNLLCGNQPMVMKPNMARMHGVGSDLIMTGTMLVIDWTRVFPSLQGNGHDHQGLASD
jgi:hypothetical protein